MSPALWVPGVLVLVLGVVAGWWFTRRKASSVAASEPRGEAEADISLELADLRLRRDELYARLRSPDLEEAERENLELEAARVLQQLDAFDADVGERPLADLEGGEGPIEASEPAAPHSRTRTLLTGFAFGGGSAALIVLLIFWAGRDATEREEMPGAPGGVASSEQPHPVPELPPEMAAEVEQILDRLESEPGDVAARKRLALLYLSVDQYVPAFEQAEAVLAVEPNDIDSLYVQGVVRMTMGQDELALDRLDRVLELFPEHVRAMTVKGLVYARQGDRDQAASLWNQALEVGGPQPQIENLLAMLEAEASGELPPGHPTTQESGQGAPQAAPDEYRARVEADVIAGFPQTGTLFVSLRGDGGGPPIAVKRIDQPAFPMLINIGARDMMMAQGGELPEAGILTVRLDQDGSASTKGENDLEGSAPMNRGDLVTIFLD